MAITSLAGVISGLQPPQMFSKLVGSSNSPGRLWSSWPLTGFPAAGPQSTTLDGAILTGPVANQIQYNDPPSGNGYIARFQGSCNQIQIITPVFPYLMVADRLWSNGGINTAITTVQTISPATPTWPARDVNGGTNGEGVYLAVEVSAGAPLAGVQIITCDYTNSAGVAVTGVNTIGSQGSTIHTMSAAGNPSTSGNFYPLGLAPDDLGVKSVQTIKFDIAWSGTVNLVAWRPLMLLESGYTYPRAVDALTGAMPRLFNGTVPFIVGRANGMNNNASLIGEVQFTQG
jgi:hypothetical protein